MNFLAGESFSGITDDGQNLDAVLAALITKLVSFADMLRDVKNSFQDIRQRKDILISKSGLDQYEFLLKSIAQFPLEAIKRVTRERILDLLVVLDAGLGVELTHEHLRDVVKGIVQKLWGLGNASSFLVSTGTPPTNFGV